MAEQERPQRREMDLDRPCAARIDDAFLGGGHNFGLERQFVDRAEEVLPGITESYRENRAFLRRTVEYLAGHGVRQFLDLGSGIPTIGSVHEIARRRIRDFRVLYVDNEPLTAAHSTRLLAEEPRAAITTADLRDPAAVLGAPETLELLDLEQPVALVLSAVLHFVPDADDPQALVTAYREALAPGSHVVVSHLTGSTCPEQAHTLQALYADTADPLFAREADWIDTLFGDLELLSPGAGLLGDWRPDPGDSLPRSRHPVFHGGMARKKLPTSRGAVRATSP